MKKLSYLWTLLLALMVGVSFVSCDDDDEGDVGAPKELLGTWLWYGEEITFNANGSGVLVEDGESYPFSFTYDAASKTLTVSADGEVMRWTIVSISNSKMVAVDEEELSYWKWADKANGTLYAYDEGEMADGATATTVFYGNRVNVIENFTDYSEEDDLVLRSIYTTVLEAAY